MIHASRHPTTARTSKPRSPPTHLPLYRTPNTRAAAAPCVYHRTPKLRTCTPPYRTPAPPSRPPPAQPRASSKVLWCAFPVSLELVCRDRTRHHRHRARSKVLWCAFPVSLEFDCGNYDRTSPSPTLRARLKVLWCAFPAVLSYPARPHPVIIRQRSMPPPEKYYGDEKNRGGDKERG